MRPDHCEVRSSSGACAIGPSQVVLGEEEWREFRDTAPRHGMTLSEWVRRTLRQARRGEAAGDPEAKLEAVRRSAEHQFPTADIDQMLEQIERGASGRGAAR